MSRNMNKFKREEILKAIEETNGVIKKISEKEAKNYINRWKDTHTCAFVIKSPWGNPDIRKWN